MDEILSRYLMKPSKSIQANGVPLKLTGRNNIHIKLKVSPEGLRCFWTFGCCFTPSVQSEENLG